MCHLSEASHNGFVFHAGNLSFLIAVIWIWDKLRKRCHKFKPTLKLSQSFEQEDLSSSKNFFPFDWTNNWTTLMTLSIKNRLSSYFGFLWKIQRFSLVAASKKLFGRLHILIVSAVTLSWCSYFTSLLYFSYIILFVQSFSFRTTCSRLAETILHISIQILKNTIYFV